MKNCCSNENALNCACFYHFVNEISFRCFYTRAGDPLFFSLSISFQIADAYTGDDKSLERKQKGLLYALYVTPFICILGAMAYMICGKYLAEDKRKADEEALIEADVPPTSPLDNLPSGSDDGETTNPPVDRSVVPDLYDHIRSNESDSDSYEEDEEDTSHLIHVANKTNRRYDRIV